MAIEFDAPEDVQGDGGNYLSEPGTYHFLIKEIKEGVGPKGNAIDGFSMELETLGGTTDGCAGKVHTETIFQPNLTHGEAAQLASRRRMAAFFIAAGLMDPNNLGKRTSIEISQAAERQILIRLARQKEKDAEGKYTVDTKFLQIDYAAIFHVDDPEVKDIPKNADAIGFIPKELRHDASWFAFKEKKAAKAASQPTVAAASSSDFDSL